MEAIPSTSRLRHGAVPAVVAALVLITGWASTGCSTGGLVDKNNLIADLAASLARSEGLTYTAEYELDNGNKITIARAQHPSRTMVRYPGGEILVQPGQIAQCTTAGRQRCTQGTAPPPGATDPLQPAEAAGLVTSAAVSNLLTAAANANATFVQRDTTIAGQHATCVAVTGLDGVASFDTCVTSVGLLASFSGTINGKAVETTLSRYQDTADETAFNLPRDAEVGTR